MKIAIVGGGLTGLTAGYRLSSAGHRVTILEKTDHLGGLASSFKKPSWQWSLECFFHHLFTSDKEIIDLAEMLGIGNKIFFLSPKTSIFNGEKISQFDSAVSVLQSPLLSLPDKLRTGLLTTYLKLANNWKDFEKTTAENWLKKFYGRKVYQTIWEPLLKSKFADKAGKISMAWFWARIKKRSFRLGYFQGGFQVFIDKLAEKIKDQQGEIFLKHEVKNLKDLAGFEKIIFTTPVEVFLKIAGKIPEDFQSRLEKLSMIGAINLILIAKEKFLTDNTYWLNINAPDYPFVAVVQQTNFVDKKFYGQNQLLYVGGYYPQNHPYFSLSRESLFKTFLPYLQKINPAFNFKTDLLGMELSANQYAQPVIPTNYSGIIPSLKTPLKNVYLATMHHISPWDRGSNYAVKLGKEVADEILKEI